tara:strand:- start:314 stop:775 length:462 start_codon:yes stop_codon:yes gene_type:complete
MVVAETLAGIALVKGAVDGIKSAIATAKDVSDIAHDIDKLFEGEQQVQKDRRKANDPFSVKSVAEETINAKLAREHMDEMRQLIDMRFGHGTWQGIIAERARRIQAMKEQQQAERIAKRKKHEAFVHDLQFVVAIVGGLMFLVVVLIIMFMYL